MPDGTPFTVRQRRLTRAVWQLNGIGDPIKERRGYSLVTGEMTMRVMILAMVLIGTLTDATSSTAREPRPRLTTPPPHPSIAAAL